MTYPIIIGAGGGKSGGSGRVAKEAPNTLKSKQTAHLIDLISEGEIVGLVDGAKSIYLDGVPLMSSDGTSNFDGYSYEVRTGTQDQAPVEQAIKGTITTIQNPSSSTKIRYGELNAQEVSVTDPRVRFVDVTVGVPALTNQDKKTGDLNGSEVSFQISMRSYNGSWIPMVARDLKGKCTSVYQESHRLITDGFEFPVYVRVERTTPDSEDIAISNNIYWYSYTLHIPTTLNYPNSALVGFTIDSEQFSSIPTRGYEIDGIKIRVPTNYNPITREYTGEWDGSFKIAWSNNPVWVFYDLLIEPRYGLGDFITEDQVDKWALYPIAKYCDELVPNGFGGTEPRFTCNMYIQSQDEAFRLLNNLASIFRAMQYWALSQLSVNADMPKDPVCDFTPANVINGEFSYSGSSAKTRHTVALVTWNDPKDQYKQKIEYVEDYDGLSRYGVIQTDVIAYGCTSQGQAHRLGKWLLYTEQMETETVTFKTGIENVVLLPGSIIRTSDPFRAGARMGGRIQQVVNSTTLVLDVTIGDAYSEIPNGTYALSIFNPTQSESGIAGGIEVRTGTIFNGTFTSTTGQFTANPQPNAMWVASQADVLEPEMWRVVSVVEDEPGTAVVTALEYRPDKYAFIENDLVLEERPVSINSPTKPRTPTVDETTGWFREYMYYAAPGLISTGVLVSWTSNYPRYIVRYKKTTDTAWTDFETVYPAADIKPIEPGLYDVEVIAIDTLDRRSLPRQVTMEIFGKTTPPREVTGFVATKVPAGVELSWDSNIKQEAGITVDLDMKGYEVREIYSTELPPLTKFNGDQIQWMTLAEARVALGDPLYTEDQFNAAKNVLWDSAAGGKLSSGLVFQTTYLDISAIKRKNLYLIKAVDTSDNYSNVPVLSGVEVFGPEAITIGSYRIDSDSLVISWTPPNADLGISHYKVAYDQIVDVVPTAEFRKQAWFTGSKTFSITAVDTSGNESPQTYSITATIDIVSAPTLTSSILADSYILKWSTPTPSANSLPIIEYEVRTDTQFGSVDSTVTSLGANGFYSLGLLAKTLANQFSAKVTWAGSITFYVAAKDSAGNYGNIASVSIEVIKAGVANNFRTSVVDNNVLLYWDHPAIGSLPVVEYEIRKGTNWASPLEVIGTKSGKFTSIFETAAGTYNYMIAAVDSAGVYGDISYTTAQVNQPPDYILLNNAISSMSGTTSNSKVIDGVLYMPVDALELYQNHFTSRSWSTPQDQVNAGYPIYIQPTPSTGYYEEVRDYGTVIASSMVTITATTVVIDGSPAITYSIWTSTDNVNWTLAADAKSAFLSGFRYIKYRITCTGGLVSINQIGIRLDMKQKTFSGSISCNAADSGGTTVYLTNDYTSTGTKVFIDVQSIVLTPGVIAGANPIAIYDFTDAPNPLSFKILLLDSATGTRLSGTCSYAVRGL